MAAVAASVRRYFFMGSDEDKSEKFDNNGMHDLEPDVRGRVPQHHGLDLSGCLGFWSDLDCYF